MAVGGSGAILKIGADFAKGVDIALSYGCCNTVICGC
jgi:hypothetical protein